ncbi:MAG: EAL domain-containing protein [Butyrivibrio sp.]|nr:EAL domain-containing protein [Butyrivibrio sp.]
MDDNLKVQFFDELFDIFSNQKDGWYAFYADYSSGKVHWSSELMNYFGMPQRVMDNNEALDKYISLIHPDDYEKYTDAVKDMFDGKTDSLIVSYRIKNKFGKYTTVSTYSQFKRDELGRPLFYAGYVVNYEKHDMVEPTTGLYTVKVLMTHLEELVSGNKSFFLLLFSIRNFTSINTKYGYVIGNQLLHEVAEIALSYRNGALVYRLEGTKFALLKDFDDDNANVNEYAQKTFNHIKNQLKSGINIDDHLIKLDIFGGGVNSTDNSVSTNTIYTSALYALSKSKEAGMTELNILNTSSVNETREKLYVLNEIRESVLNSYNGFYLVYQPIFSSDERKLVSMESLLRWRGESYGEIMPNTFIEWLEKDPVFYDLGIWILETALETAKPIINIKPDFIVNVNLAYPQLERDEFENDLKIVIEKSKVNPKNIRLELTERCRLLDKNLLIHRMEFIKSLGIQTSLDDFGTGYSAINLLFELPTNQIKIDKEFIKNIETEKPKQIMLKAITDCARILNAHVCIEGIESKEMADYICSNYNITSLQGYYFSKPVEIETFMDNIGKWL